MILLADFCQGFTGFEPTWDAEKIILSFKSGTSCHSEGGGIPTATRRRGSGNAEFSGEFWRPDRSRDTIMFLLKSHRQFPVRLFEISDPCRFPDSQPLPTRCPSCGSPFACSCSWELLSVPLGPLLRRLLRTPLPAGSSPCLTATT